VRTELWSEMISNQALFDTDQKYYVFVFS